jgi:cobalt-zinc-cadmium efflux system outer membrane protein
VEREIQKRLWAVALAFSSIAPGCATIEPKLGFTDVQSAVAERIDHEVQWDQGTVQDSHVRESVTRLFGEELSLDASLQVALLNNPTLQATYEDLGVAQADLVQAGLRATGVLGIRTFSSRLALPDQPEFDVAMAVRELALSAGPEAGGGGNFEARKHRVIDAVLDLAARVKAAYYGLQASRAVADIVRDVAEVAARRLSGHEDAGGRTSAPWRPPASRHSPRSSVSKSNERSEVESAREVHTRLMG